MTSPHTQLPRMGLLSWVAAVSHVAIVTVLLAVVAEQFGLIWALVPGVAITGWWVVWARSVEAETRPVRTATTWQAPFRDPRNDDGEEFA